MKKRHLNFVADLFKFKIIFDEYNREYVVFNSNPISKIDNIADKTQFEAVENHVHLCDNIKKRDFNDLTLVGENLGQALFFCLKSTFPDKDFVVFVSIQVGFSMIIRFHQKWNGEDYYYDDSLKCSQTEVVLKFE